jgi:hypothetical protein
MILEIPEICRAYEENDDWFLELRHTIGGIARLYRIGITMPEYKDLQRVLQYRPYDSLDRSKPKIYFVPAVAKRDGAVEVAFRIVQGKNAKNHEFKITERLASNLIWFYKLETHDDAMYLALE